MERYEKYKDSGIEWIGKIPEGWEVKPLKMATKIIRGKFRHRPRNDTAFYDGQYPFIQTGDVACAGKYVLRSNQTLNEKGFAVSQEFPADTLVMTIAANIGDLAILAFKACFPDSIVGFHPLHKNSSEFLYYLFSSMKTEFLRVSTNNTQLNINIDRISPLKIPIPPEKEQTATANYLDNKTSEIDALIAQKERLIELYEEEKIAIINQAVTKGIAPEVKLKDGGIDWLGEIPDGWKLKRLRYVGNCQNGVSKGADYFGSGFPFVSYSDVYKNFVLPTNVEGLAKSTEIDQANYSVIKGDVFFTRTSEISEEIGIASTCLDTIENAIFAGFLIKFRPFDGSLFTGFSKYYFRSKLHRFFFVKEMNLVTRASLSQELLKRLPVILPPIHVQKQIAAHLDKEIARINSKITKTKKIIALQKEYRTALISEVVTGKIKVTQEVTS